MPQKQPPATTAVSSDFEEARGASTAGFGNAAFALARPSLGLAVVQARTPIPAKIKTAISTARMVETPKPLSVTVYARRNGLDVSRRLRLGVKELRPAGPSCFPNHRAWNEVPVQGMIQTPGKNELRRVYDHAPSRGFGNRYVLDFACSPFRSGYAWAEAAASGALCDEVGGEWTAP